MNRLILTLLLSSVLLGCIERHEPPPPPAPATSPGLPGHWDVGSTILSHPLPADMADGYIELGRAPGMSYGITIAHEGLSARHHERSDLLFYVHSGGARFNVADKTFQAGMGDAVYIPRGATYTAQGTSNQPLQLVTIYSPPLDRNDISYSESSESGRHEVSAPPGKK